MGAVEDIPQATEDALRQAGCQVQRISGTPQQIQDDARVQAAYLGTGLALESA